MNSDQIEIIPDMICRSGRRVLTPRSLNGSACYELTDEVSLQSFSSETSDDFFKWPRNKATYFPPYFCSEVVDEILPEDPSHDSFQEKQSSQNKLDSTFVETSIQNIRQIVSIRRKETVIVNNSEVKIEQDFEAPESWGKSEKNISFNEKCGDNSPCFESFPSSKDKTKSGQISVKNKEKVAQKHISEGKNMKECYINLMKVTTILPEDTYKKVNETILRHKCEYCDYEVASKFQLKTHIDAEHKGIRYYCDHCPYEAKTKRSVKLHFMTVHDGFRFKCDDCNYQAKKNWELKRHVRIIHDGFRFKCDDCDYQAKRKWNLKIHIESTHNKTRHKCDKCDYEGTTKGNLKRHVESVHDGIRN